MEGTLEVAASRGLEFVLMKVDVFLRREIDLRRDLIGLLRPVRKVDAPVKQRLRTVAQQIDAAEVQVRPVDRETRAHVRVKRLVLLDRDDGVRERCTSAVDAIDDAAVDRHAQIAGGNPPWRSMILIRERAAR